MGLDLSLYDKHDNEVAEMNWLRNPFGLENWAEDNTELKNDLPKSLWQVCNEWSYAKSSEVDRKLFLEIVQAYWQRIKELEQGYFFFDFRSYRHFIEPKRQFLPTEKLWPNVYRIPGEKWVGDRLAIPQDLFTHPVFDISAPRLSDYKAWFKRLVGFAEELQDESLRFYCSN